MKKKIAFILTLSSILAFGGTVYSMTSNYYANLLEGQKGQITDEIFDLLNRKNE